MNEKVKVTVGLLALMLLLGVADATFLEGAPEKAEIAQADPVVAQPTQPNLPPPPNGGVRKATGPDILQTLVSNQFTFNDTREKFILAPVLRDSSDSLEAKALLIDGDRAGAIGWVSSPNVKKHYLVLKEALHSAFTPEVKDLLDETQRRENHPTRNLLTFLDTGILPERVVFVRVRERLYEFHIVEGSSEAIFNLIEDLTE
tara:strand:+ start:1612 stop:2217 length:606 start_codon:yes stop_codon:yes gene_type:complete